MQLVLLGQLLGFALLVLQMLTLVVLHNMIQVDKLSGLNVSGGVGLEGPIARRGGGLADALCATDLTSRVQVGGEAYSGYETLTYLCLLEAFSNRLRSKPACSAAFV